MAMHSINSLRAIFGKRALPRRKRRTVWRPSLETLERRLPLAGDLVVTEIHYNPKPPPSGSVAADNTDFEFIEIQNVGTAPRQMQGVNFSDGIGFTFPESTLAVGARAVVVRNPAAFVERYGPTIPIAGTFTGLLSDAGETITLRDAANVVIQSFTYADTWAAASDGVGHSLVARDANQPLANFNLPGGWHASSRIGGSPGAVDTGIYPGAIVINELLAHQDVALGDWVELHNTSTIPINLGGWYLSDNPFQTNLYPFPAAFTIAPGGYLVVSQAFHFGSGANGFGFSELGEDIVLTAPLGPSGEVYGEKWQFGATDNGVSLGRYVTSTGKVDLAVMSQLTRGVANSAPQVGPIVISEIMYNPTSGEEYIELHNPTTQAAQLFDPLRPTNTWRFTQGITYTFPQNVSIAAGGYLLVVDDDPELFRAERNVPASVQIFSYSSAFPDSILSNARETIELARPGEPEPVGSPQPGFVPYYTVDRVSYDEDPPWPAAADGGGPSLLRKTQSAYGNDPENWQAGVTNGSPGLPDADLIGPRVTSVEIGGTTWAGGDMAVAFGDAKQLAPLPFYGINRITLTFDEPVTITATSLALVGVNTPTYALTPSVDPGVASQTITWTLATPLTADRLMLDLENEQTLDGAGNRLDGEWMDGVSIFPSGDGTRGGDFRFAFNVLAGDVNQDGSVTPSDLALARQRTFSVLGDAKYDLLSDVDASGKVNVVDLIRIRNAIGATLPPAASPVATPSAAAAVTASIDRNAASRPATAQVYAAARVMTSCAGRRTIADTDNAIARDAIARDIIHETGFPNAASRRRSRIRGIANP